MKTVRIIMTILFVALLLSSTIAAMASPPQIKQKIGSSLPQMSDFTNSQPGVDKVGRARLKDKAKQAIEDASEMIAEAEELLEEVREAGLPVPTMIEELLNSAKQTLERAKQLLDEAPEDAFSVAMHAKSLVKTVIDKAKRLLNQAAQVHVNKTFTESRCRKFKEIFENLMDRALRLRLKLLNLTRMDLNVSEIRLTLDQIIRLINETLSSINVCEIPANIDEILDYIERLLDEIEDSIKSVLETMTTTTTASATTHVEETSKTIKKTHMSRKATFNKTVKTEKIPRTNVTKTLKRTKAISKYLTKIKEINITVTTGRGAEVKIEHYMTMESGVQGTSMVKETLISVGNKTLIKISKELMTGNKSIAHELVIEKNQTIIGALVRIGKQNSSQIKLDLNLNITMLNIEKNKLKLRIEAPNGTPGRIIVVQLEPGAIDLSRIKEFKVLVDGREAILASSILDLASEVYQEPAYVFVISSKGASVLLYIPHFSGYTIEILGIIETIRSILIDALSRTLTRDLLIVSTIAATLIASIIAISQIRRKKHLQRI